jgi:AraC-like DNA-binding protein
MSTTSPYIPFPLPSVLPVEELVTFFFFELKQDYYFKGEKHDFWEMLYVDKGEIDIFTDLNSFSMKQGDVVFYSPNEFHSCRARAGNPPNVIVISFVCKAPAMNFYQGKCLRLNDHERNLLTKLLSEAYQSFDPPTQESMLGRKKHEVFGSEQMIKNYLEILLIEVIRRYQSLKSSSDQGLSTLNKEQTDHILTRQLISYMEGHIASHLTLDQICRVTGSGKSKLKAVFKAHTGLGILEYFHRMKINHAKSLIRKEQYNFTEIADMLGYSSVYYFFRQFKKITGMTPNEYSRSAGARLALKREANI